MAPRNARATREKPDGGILGGWPALRARLKHEAKQERTSGAVAGGLVSERGASSTFSGGAQADAVKNIRTVAGPLSPMRDRQEVVEGDETLPEKAAESEHAGTPTTDLISPDEMQTLVGTGPPGTTVEEAGSQSVVKSQLSDKK
ncbi:hypothetical protein NDU88_001129 [Pleurodeles waltl]|uniref:Uncharacterized protein n=1 Tax=Pleurodeles waltl TaxID=8319 RepID=A0AAV7MRX1_PLEWA|nr:hypothetical protein NDU88_001129 [Pleurodeles waltl]